MEGLAELTQETIEQVNKAAQTSGIYAGSGIQGVDLSGMVSLVPVNVPARNNTSASLTNTQEQDVYAPYKPLAKAGRVTLDSVGVSKNFADVLAVAELQTLMALFISQDTHIINSQNWALGAPAQPVLTTATTGGSIGAAANVYVRVAARSGANYFIGGGNSVASASQTILTGAGATNSVGASIPAVRGAVAYDWYVGSTAAAGAEFYYTTTTVANVTITSIPGAAAALPSLPLLSSVAAPATAPALDTSWNVNWYNGVIASSLGDYGAQGPVTPGTGTPTGATFIDNAGAAISGSGSSIALLDQINDALWTSVQLSPTAYMVNSLQADEISKLLLGSAVATTFLPPTDSDARTNLAGGGFVGRYINKAAGGVPVDIEVHPRVAPGTIIARTDRVPFPGSNIGTAYEVRTLFDSWRFDYAASFVPGVLGGGPRRDFEIRSLETLVNTAPSCQCVASNIG
ncbi:MAG: hypothetical protein ACLP0J_28250 [Solirubrobacteraceae bacterium]